MTTEPAPGTRVPEGPHFVYGDGQDLFLGRHGAGPLKIVWDTNILIDYLEHGRDLWEGNELAPGLPYADELDALHLVISLWAMRDIRMRILARSINDAKRRLAESRRIARTTAFNEMTAALSLDMYDDEEDVVFSQAAGLLTLPDSVHDSALRAVPDGADRELVREALALGSHVFLTRDQGILRCAPGFRPLGLVIASPLELVEHLSACGAILCLLDRRYAQWPLPDLQRLAHLVQALGVEESE